MNRFHKLILIIIIKETGMKGFQGLCNIKKHHFMRHIWIFE